VRETSCGVCLSDVCKFTRSTVVVVEVEVKVYQVSFPCRCV
jgi:hypothetical protein